MARLTTVDAATLRERLAAADSPRAVLALQLAIAHKEGVPVGTLSRRYGVDTDAIDGWFDAIEAGEDDALDGPIPEVGGVDGSGTADSADPDDGNGFGSADRADDASLGESAPFPLVGVTADGTVTSWNGAAEDRFGWTESEVLGRTAPFLAGETRAAWQPLWDRLMDDESVSGETLPMQRVDGTTVTVDVSATPVSRDGVVRGATLALVSLTDRREHQQRLDVLDRVLRHNLRTDMTVILGHARRIRSETDSEWIDASAAAIEDVAGSLTEASRKARRIATELERRRPLEMLDLVEIVEEAVQRARERFPGATIDADLPDVQVVLATGSLGQALDELLENAVVHADGDAPRVTVSVDTTREDGRRWVELVVADDGPGIPESERAVLKEGEETSLRHGSGLGLWFVTWTLDRCDGRLAFDESPAGGGAVRVLLRPVDRDPGLR